MKISILLTVSALLLSCHHNVAMAQTAVFPGGTVPPSVASDAQLKIQVNGIQTLLTGAITSSSGSAAVASCSGIVGNTFATIDQEITAVASCANTTLTFATTSPGCTSGRGCDGTYAATHGSGAQVSLYIVAWHHNALKAEIQSIESVLSGTAPLAGGLTVTNPNGYSFVASQTSNNAGGFLYNGNAAILSGVTTGHTMIAVTSADGACTLRADTGLNCTGTQALLPSSSPKFASVAATPNILTTFPACYAGLQGTRITVTDSSVNTWGAIIVGGGTLAVMGWCNGTNYTVAGK